MIRFRSDGPTLMEVPRRGAVSLSLGTAMPLAVPIRSCRGCRPSRQCCSPIANSNSNSNSDSRRCTTVCRHRLARWRLQAAGPGRYKMGAASGCGDYYHHFNLSLPRPLPPLPNGRSFCMAAAAASSKGRAIAGSFFSRVLAGKAASPRYWDDGNTNAVSPRGSFSFGLLASATSTPFLFLFF
jgi:hypothetical protein